MMRCKNCCIEIPEGEQYCPNCGVSIDGCYTRVQEITTIDGVKKDIVNKHGLYGWSKAKKSNPLQPHDNITYQLQRSCPHCGRKVDEDEYYCRVCAEPIPILKTTYKKRRPNKKPMTHKQAIKRQFKQDRTSICPFCGSHDIKIYRRGYDYDYAFWGTIFNMKGSKYTAGLTSNEAMCRCNSCGNRWNSGYDYRQIKK